MNLKPIILVGLMGIISCTSFPKNKLFSEKIKNGLYFTSFPPHLFLGYDTDNNGVEDLRLVYHYRGKNRNGQVYFELESIYSDLNKNRIFEEDELVWERGSIVGGKVI